MLKFIRIRLAERAYYSAVGARIAYNRRPMTQWHVSVASAHTRKCELLAQRLANAIAA